MKRALLVLTSLGLMFASLAPAHADKLRYGHIANAARSPASLGLYVAQRKGFLTREGIELEVVPLPTPTRLACMMKETCAAAALNQPEDLILIEKGYRKLGDSLEVMPELQFLVIAASRKWAAEHRDAVVRFARAYGNAYRFIRDPAHRDEVAQILVETTKVTESIARAMLALYFEPDRGALPKQAEISIRGVNKVIELLVETGQLAKPEPVERFIDLQYLRAAGMQ